MSSLNYDPDWEYFMRRTFHNRYESRSFEKFEVRGMVIKKDKEKRVERPFKKWQKHQ